MPHLQRFARIELCVLIRKRSESPALIQRFCTERQILGTLSVQASAPFWTATTRGRPFVYRDGIRRKSIHHVGKRAALLTRCSAWHSHMRALVPDPGRIDKFFFRETLAGGSIHSRRGRLFRHIIPAPRGQASGLLRFARTSGIPPPTRRIAPAGQPLLSGPQCVRTYSSSSAIANNFTVVRIGIPGR